MSEQEKEEEAAKLASLIQDLNRKGVIRTAQVGPDGRPQECSGANYLGDEAPAVADGAAENGSIDSTKTSQNK